MPTIRKTIIQVTVLSDGPEHFEFDDLRDVAYEISEGAAMGDCKVVSSEVITGADKIASEETAIGGDGTFFACLEFANDEPLDPAHPAWKEYDSVAEWCAERGIKGAAGDRLPDMLSTGCKALIDADPEAFEQRVRDCAYAQAMNKLNLPEC